MTAVGYKCVYTFIFYIHVIIYIHYIYIHVNLYIYNLVSLTTCMDCAEPRKECSFVVSVWIPPPDKVFFRKPSEGSCEHDVDPLPIVQLVQQPRLVQL